MTLPLPFILFAIFLAVIFLFSRKGKRRSITFKPIADNYKTLPEVQEAIRKAGLESSNLIIGVDFTSSNSWTGRNTFAGRSLHTISNIENPYQASIRIIGETLSVFDDDNLIPAYGFGDINTKDYGVFPFRHERACFGFEEVLSSYNELATKVALSGPTSFVPIINEAIRIVEENANAYHILVIIADGQVTDKRANMKAIARASKFPLSIVMVGVGDGPWDDMETFDDEIPERDFDNFQFVNFNEIMKRYDGLPAAFALHALMEIPDQFKAIKELGLLSK